MIEKKLIDKIFKALDRQIGVHSGLPFSIVVCGGTALAALGLIRRTTKDVDVLGEVILISRIDQIYFKLFASLDRDAYHVEDFFNLNPSKEEILMAARWVLSQDDSLEFKNILHEFLNKKGLSEIINRI